MILSNELYLWMPPAFTQLVVILVCLLRDRKASLGSSWGLMGDLSTSVVWQDPRYERPLVKYLK